MFKSSGLVEMRQYITGLLDSYHLDEFQKLLGTKRVGLKTIGNQVPEVQIIASCFKANHLANTVGQIIPSQDHEKLFYDYFDELQKVIKNPLSYPLFDHFSGKIINIGLNAGKIELTDTEISRSKPIGLAADLLQRLPAFESADVNEIIDIQRELNKPLLKFRAVMIEFSKEIQPASWENDFVYEADNVFRGKVEPIIAEIEDAVESNKYLHELGHQMLTKTGGGLILGGLAIGLLSSYHVPEIVVAGTRLLQVGSLLETARKNWAQRKQDIENNQLFFYYKANKLLESKH
jgi:hypothetical protein